MSFPPLRPLGLAAALLLAAACPGLAHPVPDVPVRSDFAADGAWMLQVEVDPRCFEDDPNVALSVLNADLALFPQDKRDKLKIQAQDYVRKVVAVVLDPPVKVEPVFDFQFTTHENAPLKTPEDVVVLTGTWKTHMPPETTGYSIHALPEGTLSVLYQNTVLGKKLERLQILFPGETSFVLDLKTWKPRTPAPAIIMAEDDGGICVSCYAADTQQTLPVVGAVVVAVLAMLWWKGKGRGRSQDKEPSAPDDAGQV